MKRIEVLSHLGIDPSLVLQFLKVECKISEGYAGQIAGWPAVSPATTGLVAYVLSLMNAYSDEEIKKIVEELFGFQRADGCFSDGENTKPCSWATSQVALALLCLKAPQAETKRVIKHLQSFQTPSGGWPFGFGGKEKLAYSIYPFLVFVKASKTDEQFREPLEKTLRYLEKYQPVNETEKLILCGLQSIVGVTRRPVINFHKIVKEEFGTITIREQHPEPFYFTIFTPSLYLFARHLVRPDNPFSVYLMKYLLETIANGRGWAHVIHDGMPEASSFCTALASFSLVRWIEDLHIRNIEPTTLVSESLNELEARVALECRPLQLFLSYSEDDVELVRQIAMNLAKIGYRVSYSRDLSGGDSFVTFMDDTIRQCDYIVVLCSKHSLDSKWVFYENGRGLEREINEGRVIVIPVRLDGCQPLPFLASRLWAADFSEEFSTAIEDLTSSIQDQDAKRKANP